MHGEVLVLLGVQAAGRLPGLLVNPLQRLLHLLQSLVVFVLVFRPLVLGRIIVEGPVSV